MGLGALDAAAGRPRPGVRDLGGPPRAPASSSEDEGEGDVVDHLQVDNSARDMSENRKNKWPVLITLQIKI
jgi:hypothetical protein